MDDATAIDEAASALTSPRRRVETLRMKDSAGNVGVGIGVVDTGAVEREFHREWTIGRD
jgi:hypothetical protein